MSLGRTETTAFDGNMGVSVCPDEEGDSSWKKVISILLLRFCSFQQISELLRERKTHFPELIEISIVGITHLPVPFLQM